MQDINRARQKILQAGSIVIASHINPDGDSIGSLLALGLGLEQLGKAVTMVSYDGVPKRYRILPGSQKIVRKVRKIFDLAIAVDCGTKELLGKTFDIFKKASFILEIDHHQVRTPFGDACIIDPKAAAVGELVYLFLKKLKAPITHQIAQNILTSIIVETNSFRLPSVRPLTFGICSQLMKTGVDFSKLSEMIYWSKAKESAIISGFALSRSKFLQQGKVAWSIVKKDDLGRIKAKAEDVDSVANDMLAIKGVEVSVLFRQEERGLLRVSLRSKGRVDVARLAQNYGGGGHSDAAGCLIPDNKRAIEEILKEAQDLVRRAGGGMVYTYV